MKPKKSRMDKFGAAALTWFIATVFVSVPGCSLTQSPHPSETFDITWETQQPTRTTPEAQLYLTDTGLWGYEPLDRDDFEADIEPGRLVRFQSDDSVHFFAVVESVRRGYLLQRLDDTPVKDNLVGEFRSLDLDAVEEQSELCIVERERDLVDECGFSHHHRRWALFELAGADGGALPEDSLGVTGEFDGARRALGLPVTRRAVAGGDSMSTWTESHLDDPFSTPLLGVRSRSGADTTVRATLGYDPSCQSSLSPSALVEPVAIDRADDALPTGESIHPVAIEDAALRTGTDTIAACHEGQTQLMIPLLSRPLLYGPDGYFAAPPSLGRIPRVLDDASDDERRAWMHAASLVAVGDSGAASFWIERAVDDEPSSSAIEELALSSTSVLASGGQPELAINVGTRLTESAWNPRNLPDHLDGLIHLLGVFDQRQEQRELIDARRTLAERHFDAQRTGWYQWSEVRLQIASRNTHYGVGYDDLLDHLQAEDLDGWAIAVWTLFAIHDIELPIVDGPEDLDSLFAQFDASTLWEFLNGSTELTRCPGDLRCAPTTYGWQSGSEGSDPTETLRSTPRADIRRAFAIDELRRWTEIVDDPGAQTDFWLAAAPLVPDGEFAEAVQIMTQRWTDHIDADAHRVCDERLRWKTRFATAADRATIPDAARSHRQWTHSLGWWADDGIDALCTGSDDFVDAVKARASSHDPSSKVLLPIVESVVLGDADSRDGFEAYRRVADIAEQLGKSDRCATWHLAISVAATHAQHLDEAEDHLIEASNCLSSNSKWVDVYDIVSGYLDFERGAGHRVVHDGSTARVVDRAANRRVDDIDACVGLVSLGFRLDTQLPGSLMQIVDRIRLEPGPFDEFGLRTATILKETGRAAYRSGLRDLQRGELLTAARALHEARIAFGRLENLPGLARIHFLDQSLYDGRLDELVARLEDKGDDDDEVAGFLQEIEADDGELRNLQAGRPVDAPRRPPASDADLRSWIVASLIDGDDERIREQVEDRSPPDSLCDPDEARHALHAIDEAQLDEDRRDDNGGALDE